MVGKRLLYSSSALAALGDAMFGYSQGVIAAAQVQPSFIYRMYGYTVSLDQIQEGYNPVNVFFQGSRNSSYHFDTSSILLMQSQPLWFLASTLLRSYRPTSPHMSAIFWEGVCLSELGE